MKWKGGYNRLAVRPVILSRPETWIITLSQKNIMYMAGYIKKEQLTWKDIVTGFITEFITHQRFSEAESTGR